MDIMMKETDESNLCIKYIIYMQQNMLHITYYSAEYARYTM